MLRAPSVEAAIVQRNNHSPEGLLLGMSPLGIIEGDLPKTKKDSKESEAKPQLWAPSDPTEGASAKGQLGKKRPLGTLMKGAVFGNDEAHQSKTQTARPGTDAGHDEAQEPKEHAGAVVNEPETSDEEGLAERAHGHDMGRD